MPRTETDAATSLSIPWGRGGTLPLDWPGGWVEPDLLPFPWSPGQASRAG